MLKPEQESGERWQAETAQPMVDLETDESLSAELLAAVRDTIINAAKPGIDLSLETSLSQLAKSEPDQEITDLDFASKVVGCFLQTQFRDEGLAAIMRRYCSSIAEIILEDPVAQPQFVAFWSYIKSKDG